MSTKNGSLCESNPKSLTHLNLTETQLNALSYSLSELADKISPTKQFVDECEWGLKAEGLGVERKLSTARNPQQSNSHTKTPYTKIMKSPAKHPLSKQKIYSKGQSLSCKESPPHKENIISNIHQESIESGYNSSWSSNSFSEDKNITNDIDIEDAVFNEAETNNTETLESKISGVEKRINSLLIGRGKSSVADTKVSTNETKEKEIETVVEENDLSKSRCQQMKDENPSTLSPRTEMELKKSPFQVTKVRKTSLDDSTGHGQNPVRPGLMRRRTTLVSFRSPRKTSVFNEVDDSGVLELDEDGFVQSLTDVRAIKTMLLKLKRELQEAEVQSPLSRSLSKKSIKTPTLVTSCDQEETKEGERLHTYDSSEIIHKKLQRIRSQSRRKQSTGKEMALHEGKPSDDSDGTLRDINNDNNKIKEENKDLKQRLQSLEQERNALLVDKEEIEHELEAKNSTIKMLQKQLETQDNEDEVTCLKQKVTSLMQQLHNQQQKITELKYQANSPRRDSSQGKHDIKHRLRDAFTRHLEESSKSHMLLSKHIEKAEFTVSEAQKGLKSLFVTSHQVTQDSETPNKKNPQLTSPRSRLTQPRLSEDTQRRHSWSINSIDKIIKNWKDSNQSFDGSMNKKSPRSKKPNSKTTADSSHMSYL